MAAVSSFADRRMKAVGGRERDTKFLEAAKRSRRDDLIALMKKGASINAVDETTGYTALHIAVEIGNLECINSLLLNGADAEAVTRKGRNICHLATKTVNAKLLQMLLSKYPNLVNGTDENDQTPLHIAFRKKSVDCSAILYGFEGCDICAVDASGSTPLHYAAASGMTKEVSKLVRMGADPNAVDGIGRTSLHYAAFAGSSGAVTALLGHNVDVSIQDAQKKTAADLASSVGHTTLSQIIRDHQATKKPDTPKKEESAGPLVEEAKEQQGVIEEKLRRRVPPLPSVLPPPPDDVDETFDGSIGLAPPDIHLPPPYIPTAIEAMEEVEVASSSESEDSSTGEAADSSVISDRPSFADTENDDVDSELTHEAFPDEEDTHKSQSFSLSDLPTPMSLPPPISLPSLASHLPSPDASLPPPLPPPL